MHKPILLLAAFCSSLFLSGCKVSLTNDLIAKHDPDIEAFAQRTHDAFYGEDEDFIIENAAKDVSGFTQTNLNAVQELISSSARPAESLVGDRGTKTLNRKKYYSSVFFTPRNAGREDLFVTLTKAEGKCCKIIGVNLQVRIGENYVMDVPETENATD